MPDTVPQFALQLNADLGASAPWRSLVQGVTDTTLQDTVGLIQADKRPIVVRFLKRTNDSLAPFTASDPVGVGSVLFGAKAKGGLEAEAYLFDCSSFEKKTDEAGDVWFEGVLELHTEQLASAFLSSSEVEWVADIEIDYGAGLRVTVAQFDGTIRRQVVDSASAPAAGIIGGTMRITNGLLQILNQDHQTWHSIIVVGEPGEEALAVAPSE